MPGPTLFPTPVNECQIKLRCRFGEKRFSVKRVYFNSAQIFVIANKWSFIIVSPIEVHFWRQYDLNIMTTYNHRMRVTLPIMALLITYFTYKWFYTITNMLRLSIYTSMNSFLPFKPWVLALRNIWDTLSGLVNMYRVTSIFFPHFHGSPFPKKRS